MVFVYLQGGDCVEVEAAVSAAVVADVVVCYNDAGVEIATFPIQAVLSYTNDPKIIEVVADEICDQPTVIPAEA
jgi:hypothetical protein